MDKDAYRWRQQGLIPNLHTDTRSCSILCFMQPGERAWRGRGHAEAAGRRSLREGHVSTALDRVSGSCRTERKGEGLRICVQPREEPMRPRPHASHSDVVRRRKNREKGAKDQSKSGCKERGRGFGSGQITNRHYPFTVWIYG